MYLTAIAFLSYFYAVKISTVGTSPLKPPTLESVRMYSSTNTESQEKRDCKCSHVKAYKVDNCECGEVSIHQNLYSYAEKFGALKKGSCKLAGYEDFDRVETVKCGPFGKIETNIYKKKEPEVLRVDSEAAAGSSNKFQRWEQAIKKKGLRIVQVSKLPQRHREKMEKSRDFDDLQDNSDVFS